MDHPQRVRIPKETPIERIFRKVLKRKMTLEEKMCFRLKPFKARNPIKSRDIAAWNHKLMTRN